MKKIVFAFTIFAMSIFASCDDDDQDRYIGSDIIIPENRDLSNFNSIDVSSIIDVNVTFDNAQSVIVTANDNIMDRVETDVSGNTLVINLKNGNYDNVSIKVDITIPDLSEIQNEGTGNVSIKEFDNLDNLTIKSTGTGNVIAEGMAQNLLIELTGTGNFKGFDFIAKSINAQLTGTGNIEVFCSDELEGTITGTGNIYYKGNPEIDVSVTGTGKVINAN